jgi:hypothetical protein
MKRRTERHNVTFARSLLSLPDETLDAVLSEALPDDYGTLSLSARTSMRGIQQYATAVRSLSQICRRVRQLLLPKLYHIVSLVSPNNKRRMAFLELVPSYGRMCRKLALRIPGRGESFLKLVELLHHQCEHLTSLQTLVLDIRLDDNADASDKTWESSDISTVPSGTRMGRRELQCWKDLCARLPKLSELHLHGFLLSDAVIGLAGAELSSIRTLGLNLGAPALSAVAPRTFNLAFSGLVDVTFPHRWCPSPAWVRQAFAGRRLEKIAVSGSVPWTTFRYDDEHECSSPVCNWAKAFELLLEVSAPSLTSLTITLQLCLQMSAERVALPCLTSLVLEGIDFDDDEESFAHFMEPFLQSPLGHLGLDNCRGVPESFCDWFDPTSGKWPDLVTLSLEQLDTTCGPGDDMWDEADEAEREEWDRADDNSDVYWRSRTRISLEEMCAKRGIQLDSDWYWCEGHG